MKSIISSVFWMVISPFLIILLLCLPNNALSHKSRHFKRIKLPANIGSEAYTFDSHNVGPYTGLNDGRIVKYDGKRFVDFATTVPNRSKELCDGTNANATLGPQCGRPLDLEYNHKTGELYIVDLYQGLMVVEPNSSVATPVAKGNGMPRDAPDALAIDPSTDEVYFTDIGTIIFTNPNATQVLQSGDKSGKLLKYNPKTKRRSVVLTGLSAPAGIAVSRDGSFILIGEYLACNLTRYWLKGPKANTSEHLVHLPGNPDNIKRTKTGDFWVAVNIQTTYPQLISFPLGQKISANGEIMETVTFYAEYNATYITEVHEHQDQLYVASIFTDFVGVYKGLRC